MARPQKAGNPRKTREKQCLGCLTNKPVSAFYASKNPLHGDGHVPICKDCIAVACFHEEENEVDIEQLKKILRQLDRPFISRLWQSAIDQFEQLYGDAKEKASRKVIIGYYFKNINTLRQVQQLGWDEGVRYEQMDHPSSPSVQSDIPFEIGERKNESLAPVYYLTGDNVEVTEEMIRLFGERYTAKEYGVMQRLYENIRKERHGMSLTQQDLLVRYVRFAAKEEIATGNGIRRRRRSGLSWLWTR